MADPVTILDHIKVATSDRQIRQLLSTGNHFNRGVEAGGQTRRAWLKAARERRLELQIVQVKPSVIKLRFKKREQRRKHLLSWMQQLRGQSTE